MVTYVVGICYVPDAGAERTRLKTVFNIRRLKVRLRSPKATTQQANNEDDSKDIFGCESVECESVEAYQKRAFCTKSISIEVLVDKLPTYQTWKETHFS